jgi:succinate dehydrogenase / fumarate reductase cytochrome b subunit
VTTTAPKPHRTEPERIKQPPSRRLGFFGDFWRSDIGKKWVMAVSGAVGILFVIAHMLGNLHVFEGEGEFNEYAEFLREILVPILPHTAFLWLLRIGLLVALVVHLAAVVSLTRKNRAARGKGWYRSKRDYVAANYASRTMLWGGIIIFAFILFHLADLTWGVEAVNPDFERGQVYSNLVESLSRWPVALFYIIANLVLAFHIYHGGWSLFQSLGINNPKFNPWRRGLAVGVAVIVAAGNISIVIAVQTGVIG